MSSPSLPPSRHYRVVLPPEAGQPRHIDLMAASPAAAILAAHELAQAPVIRCVQEGDW